MESRDEHELVQGLREARRRKSGVLEVKNESLQELEFHTQTRPALIAEYKKLRDRQGAIWTKRHAIKADVIQLMTQIADRFDSKTFRDLNACRVLLLENLQDEYDLRDAFEKYLEKLTAELHAMHDVAREASRAALADVRQKVLECGFAEDAGLDEISAAHPAPKSAKGRCDEIEKYLRPLQERNAMNDGGFVCPLDQNAAARVRLKQLIQQDTRHLLASEGAESLAIFAFKNTEENEAIRPLIH